MDPSLLWEPWEQIDLMTFVERKSEDKGKWIVTLRWRYSKKRNGDPYDEEDEKSWWKGECDGKLTEEEVIEKIDELYAQPIPKFIHKEFLPIRASGEQAIDTLAAHAGHSNSLHVRRVPKEEEDKYHPN
jgi:hypothetical protein